jgi:hypothetical protein
LLGYSCFIVVRLTKQKHGNTRHTTPNHGSLAITRVLVTQVPQIPEITTLRKTMPWQMGQRVRPPCRESPCSDRCRRKEGSKNPLIKQHPPFLMNEIPFAANRWRPMKARRGVIPGSESMAPAAFVNGKLLEISRFPYPLSGSFFSMARTHSNSLLVMR